MSSFPAAPQMIYLGLDVHKESVMIAVLPAEAAKPTRIDRYPNDFAKRRNVFERIARDGEIRACYEASGGLAMSNVPMRNSTGVFRNPL